MALRVGLSTPWDFWTLDHEQRRVRLAEIADAGVDHMYTADHISFFDGSGMDALVHLAGMSGLEPRLGLQAGVYLLGLRHPMVAARQIASLAQAAPGRVSIGVGVGGEDRHEIEVCEVDPSTRGRRTDAALVLVRRLLAGETVDGDGRFFAFERGTIRPVPNPPIPFLVGGRSDAALRRAGLLSDGWLAAWCSATRFQEGIQRVEEIADDAGREVEWSHALQLWVGVGSSPADGRTHVAAAMENFYKLRFDLFERYTPVGNARQIAEFLAPYVRAGATTLNLAPCGPDRDTELATIAEVKRLLGG